MTNAKPRSPEQVRELLAVAITALRAIASNNEMSGQARIAVLTAAQNAAGALIARLDSGKKEYQA